MSQNNISEEKNTVVYFGKVKPEFTVTRYF